MMGKKYKWLNRKISAPAPFLTLCLSKKDFKLALKDIGIKENIPWISDKQSNATAHMLYSKEQQRCAIICLSGYKNRTPIEIAGILVHEAVHIWQDYAEYLGEDSPGAEQEAYAIQWLSQTLMTEFSRRNNYD